MQNQKEKNGSAAEKDGTERAKKKSQHKTVKKMVDNGGFDPPTSRMLSVRSTN
jgi:hypothetical protein